MTRCMEFGKGIFKLTINRTGHVSNREQYTVEYILKYLKIQEGVKTSLH